MDRRTFLAGTGTVLLAAPLAAAAQQTGKVWRIGWLSPTSSLSGASELEALRQGLRELGYIEGRNLTIESRWADGEPATLPALARSLVEINVDVMCPAGTQASLAAKNATSKIPIIFAAAAFPDETGLVASYARPGSNVTGVAFIGPEYGKRLELPREVLPRLARVALLHNDNNPASLRAVKETRGWAQQLGVVLEPHGIHRKDDVETVFAAIARTPPGALMTTADPLITSYRKEIVEFVARRRIGSIYPSRNFIEVGGLMFYGTSTTDMYRRAALYVDRILKGARPADLPVEQPTKFEQNLLGQQRQERCSTASRPRPMTPLLAATAASRPPPCVRRSLPPTPCTRRLPAAPGSPPVACLRLVPLIRLRAPLFLPPGALFRRS